MEWCVVLALQAKQTLCKPADATTMSPCVNSWSWLTSMHAIGVAWCVFVTVCVPKPCYTLHVVVLLACSICWKAFWLHIAYCLHVFLLSMCKHPSFKAWSWQCLSWLIVLFVLKAILAGHIALMSILMFASIHTFMFVLHVMLILDLWTCVLLLRSSKLLQNTIQRVCVSE